MPEQLRRMPGSLGFRLYGLPVLTLLVAAGLADTSLQLADETHLAASQLLREGNSYLRTAVEAESLLLAQHRAVEDAIAAAGHAAEAWPAIAGIGTQLERHIAAAEKDVTRRDGLAGPSRRFARDLQRLRDAAQEALSLAETDRGAAWMMFRGSFRAFTDRLHEDIGDWNETRMAAADAQVRALVVSTDAAIRWIRVSAVAAMLIALAGIGFGARQVHRLRLVIRAMLGLARGDTEAAIPFRRDRDTVGDVARAAEVFKANLARLRRQAEDLTQTNLRFHAALSNMSQGLAMFDRDGRLVVVNRRYSELSGIPPREVRLGRPFGELIECGVIASGCRDPKLVAQRRTDMLALVARKVPLTFTREMGERVIVVTHMPMADGGWVGTFTDMTEERRTDARIAFMAHHDPLTQLPNRLKFQERLDHALTQTGRGDRFALLCVDLDHFKPINDTLGHAAGDAVLKEVAARLLACVREGDTVARVGGDEFVIIQTRLARSEDAAALAERVVASLGAPIEFEGRQVRIECSIGVALAPDDGASSDDLMHRADIALYAAKAQGRSTFRLFAPEMDAQHQARRAAEQEVREAYQAGRFEMAYQPRRHLATGETTGLAAMPRWNHPVHGMLSAEEFLPKSQRSGLALAIEEWALRRACAEAASWPVPVVVRLSAAQFTGRDPVAMVQSALAASGLPPERLELEVAQAALLPENEAAFRRLAGLGVRLSLGDFGTGRACLEYLRNCPFHRLRIDAFLVRHLPEWDFARAMVRAIVDLGGRIGLSSLAEGVATSEQAAILDEAGCTEALGPLFGGPLPAGSIQALLVSRIATGEREPGGLEAHVVA